jgi:CS domain
MPDLPSSGHLKLVPEKKLLFPKFQSYKLQNYSEEDSLSRIALPASPSRPVLPNNARVGFSEVQVRTSWNHLTQGWQNESVLYVSTSGEIVRIKDGQASVIANISFQTQTNAYGYYPNVIEIASDILVATDGLGQLCVIRDGAIVASFVEEIPFVLLDGRYDDNKVDVLICQALSPPLEASTSRPSRGEYQLQYLRLTLSPSLEYSVVSSLSGTGIPKHAVLTPDILLVTQSPFRIAKASTVPDIMELDNESVLPPLYTYFQTETDLDISIPLPLVTPKESIQVNFSTSTLQLHFLPPTSSDHPDLSETFPFQTAEEKPLWGAIDPMNSTWTLSSTTSNKILDIHLEKILEGESHWPQVFEDPDGAEEYTDPSERRTILERLEKYTQSHSNIDTGDAVRRRFLLEEDEDIDSVDAGDLIQLFRGSQVSEAYGHDLIALPFHDKTLGVKVSVDMCIFNVFEGHVRTFPAFNFVASSKRLKKYCRYTDQYALIVESGRGGNMYVYYMPDDSGQVAKQLVVRLGVESLGVGLLGEDVVIVGESERGPEALIVRGL